MRVVYVLLAGCLGLVAGCAGVSRYGDRRGVSGAPSSQDVAGAPARENEEVRIARAWIRERLLAQAYPFFNVPDGVEHPRSLVALQYESEHREEARSLDAAHREERTRRPHPYDDLTSPEIVARFIDAGRDVIPDLVPHMRDRRRATWMWDVLPDPYFTEPPKSVGWVACYLTEAILRQTPAFTPSGVLYDPVLSVGDDIAYTYSNAAVNAAASVYEAWFARCYDAARREWRCADDDLPDVGWWRRERPPRSGAHTTP